MSVMTRMSAEMLEERGGAPHVTNVDSMAGDVIEMRVDDVHRLTGDNRWRVVICREGQVWITQEHDWRDYVLDPGDIFVISQRGQVLIEALREASVEITPSVRTSSYAGRLPSFA